MKNLFAFTNCLKGHLSSMKERWKKEDVESLGISVPATVRVGLATDFYLFKVLRMIYSEEDGKTIKACQKSGAVALELTSDEGEIQYCIFDGKDNTMKACLINEGGAFLPYDEDKHGGTILKAAMLCFFSTVNPKLAKLIGELYEYCKFNEESEIWEDPLERDSLSLRLCAVTNACYYSMKERFGSDKVKIEKLRPSDLKTFEDAFNLYGKPSFCKSADATSSAASVGKVVRGKFALNPERKLTPLEESLVPVMPDSYVCDPVVETIAKDILDSSKFEQPFRTVLLYGDSGSGKTSAVKALASLLNLPYVKITFSPDTDKIEIVGSILPNTEKIEVKDLFKKLNIPTYEDVANDFEGSYKKLFGKEPGKLAAPEDCYEVIMNKVLEGVKMSEDFVFVPSNIIQGGENGWVVEIQEAALLKRESELCTINAFLENVSGTTITLPTGGETKRHPDSVFVFTTNMDYKGCKSLQQSVLSRCNIKREIKTPTAEVMAKRCLAQVKLPKDAGMPKLSETLALKMAKVCKEIAGYCKDHDITDGVCGPRELNDWAKKSILAAASFSEESVTDETVALCAFPVLLEKVSQVSEEMEEVVTAVFQKFFTQETIERGRDMYECGEI